MSRVQTSTFRRTDTADATEAQLREGVRVTAQRGRLLASLSIVLLCAAALVGGLLILALKDAIFDLPSVARLALLILLVTGSLGTCLVLALRLWLNQQFNRAAGEQIDHAAHATQQPVTVGLSINDPIDDDSLALALIHRAQSRATEVTQSIKPAQAYPLRRLRGPGMWLSSVLAIWLALAIVMPGQTFAQFARVALPWGDTPPFSFTQLVPQWEPAPPVAGDDVTLTVEPTGLQPESVDWVRLDERGDEAERFTMAEDGQGGFRHLLKRVDSPMTFRLEARGRHTRTYTITPTPRPTATEAEDLDDDATGDAQGSTTFDPEKIARRDLDAHRHWPALKAKLQALLDELAKAQSSAQDIDPADAQALQALADKLTELTEQAKQIAGELSTLQGELPAEAAALLGELKDALTNMQSAALPAPPGPTGDTPSDGQSTSSQWLNQAADATQADQQKIGKGVGASDLPSVSGTSSGESGDGPVIRDPAATGTYDGTIESGDAGVLPDAVMQQIPPSYRRHVSAYFDRLAEEQDRP